mmetsp:Transcript_7019/g.17309  ORF Transcript_7019/g.17309 Transcript_7019/m.17309 type:complete len:210 (-) Transcript_7019:699-1328(-)
MKIPDGYMMHVSGWVRKKLRNQLQKITFFFNRNNTIGSIVAALILHRGDLPRERENVTKIIIRRLLCLQSHDLMLLARAMTKILPWFLRTQFLSQYQVLTMLEQALELISTIRVYQIFLNVCTRERDRVHHCRIAVHFRLTNLRENCRTIMVACQTRFRCPVNLSMLPIDRTDHPCDLLTQGLTIKSAEPKVPRQRRIVHIRGVSPCFL